jgi:hypothetical protein
MKRLHEPERSGKVEVRPLLLGPKNCLAAIGADWRWCRDQARALGVPLVGSGRKQFVRADLFLAALEAASNDTAEPEDETDAAAEIRRLVGCGR